MSSAVCAHTDFLCPVFKPCDSLRLRSEEREETRRRCEQKGVLSDSENEEPITIRIRHISAFIRKTSTALSSGGQRSRSCSEPVEDRGKLRVVLQPALTDPMGACHSLTAGILLSSENSRSVSVPIVPPQRRLAWSAVVPAPAGPLSQWDRGASSSLGQTERSVSPDSNDSISEELNHFKPIVCSPCTPPKRLSDGRLLEPRIVKSTPRNLRQLGTSSQGAWLQTSAVVMQKWRQIELDRQKVSAAMEGCCPVSVATLTSPVNDSHAAPRNRRRLLFDAQEQVPLKVPAIRPQDQSLGLRFKSTSKRKQNPKLRESKRRRPDANPEANCTDANSYGKRSVKASATVSAQERADRALALQLQRHFDGVSDPYFLRSASQSADRGRSLRSTWTNQSADRGRSLRSSRRLKRHKD
ncbi:E3 ubiquitin-protein ligase RNF169 isoform X2 [Periophthalmus magnuspinnatus]|uniref:E3 ubiquitin-protein ligase RNF169 isoform X2 n=1 Tax=Periophthalmus magnuspinnatus TaxID=409849 RepID=UPI0024362EB4|nr:E3 ubiquitin-protein ligase RNF169 isoform X2 [Periophthalmus magnuspinnatus]